MLSKRQKKKKKANFSNYLGVCESNHFRRDKEKGRKRETAFTSERMSAIQEENGFHGIFTFGRGAPCPRLWLSLWPAAARPAWEMLPGQPDMRGLHSAGTAVEGVLTRGAVVSEQTVFGAFKLYLDKSPSQEKGRGAACSLTNQKISGEKKNKCRRKNTCDTYTECNNKQSMRKLINISVAIFTVPIFFFLSR